MIGKVIGFIILAILFINVMLNMLPATFNSTATTSFTVWGTDYLWYIGLVALIVVFGGLLIFWNEAKKLIGK